MVDERNIRKHCIWSFWSASLSLFVPAVLQALWLSHPSENYRSFLSFEGAEIISETICWLFRISRNWTHPPSQPLVYVTDTDCTTTGGSNVVLIDQFKSQTFAFDCWHQWGQTHSCTFHNPGLRLHYAVKISEPCWDLMCWAKASTKPGAKVKLKRSCAACSPRSSRSHPQSTNTIHIHITGYVYVRMLDKARDKYAY